MNERADRIKHVPVYVGNVGDTVWTTDERNWTSTQRAPAPPGATVARVVKIRPNQTAVFELS